MRMRPSRVLQKLRAGKVATCVKINLADPRVAEIAGLLPNWLDQRRRYRQGRQLLREGERAAAYCELKRLETDASPFPHREHLYFYLWRSAGAVEGEETAQLYLRRLIAHNPNSPFLALPM